jgi:protein pelota
MRVRGRNIKESEHVKMGAYHTIDLELNRSFTITKSAWDVIDIERLETACDPSLHADLAVVVLHVGLCHVCVVSSHMTITKSKIEMSIPRKRNGVTSQHDKGMTKFFEGILNGIMRHIDFSVVKCVLVASPGFLKDDFFTYMMEEASRKDYKVILENKHKFVKTHSSSGHKHAIKEILADPSIASRLSDTKATLEVDILETFFKLLHDDPDRAYFGYKDVKRAVDVGAVDVLCVTDSLFRSVQEIAIGETR